MDDDHYVPMSYNFVGNQASIIGFLVEQLPYMFFFILPDSPHGIRTVVEKAE